MWETVTRKTKLAVIVCGLLFALGATGATGISEQAPAAQTPTIYPQTVAGFSSQIAAAVESYQKGDVAGGRRLLEQLSLPQSSDWFTKQIGPAQSAILTERYNRLLDNFVNSLEKTIEDMVHNKGSKLVTDLKTGTRDAPQIRIPNQKLSGITPLSQPPLYNCAFAINVNGSEVVSWMDTFTYQDGAFRFIGHAAWPFWVWEDGSDGRSPEAGNFTQPPILIARIPPVYPKDYEQRGIDGDVILHISIDANGSVGNITVVHGDPTFTKAAIDAVKKWRYKPETFGGQPIKSDVNVTVSFKHP